MATVNKSQARIEGLKEFGRIVLIAAVSSALVAAQAAAGVITDPVINVGLVTLLTSLGKAWDKYLHKNQETQAKGLVPF